MRTFVIAVFVLFTLAPTAYAAHALGEDCSDQAGCIASVCDPNSLKCVAAIQPVGTNPAGNSAPVGTNPSVTLMNPLQGGGNLQSFLLNILSFVIDIGGIFVVLMLVYVGYLFVVAQGNETKISAARSALLWTVIGALILLGSKAIALGIQATVTALSSGG